MNGTASFIEQGKKDLADPSIPEWFKKQYIKPALEDFENGKKLELLTLEQKMAEVQRVLNEIKADKSS